jgi:hypothetical protein
MTPSGAMLRRIECLKGVTVYRFGRPAQQHRQSVEKAIWSPLAMEGKTGANALQLPRITKCGIGAYLIRKFSSRLDAVDCWVRDSWSALSHSRIEPVVPVLALMARDAVPDRVMGG